MPWPESVVGKLREQVAAIRAFWQAWQNGERLNFRGEHYKLTLMSPFFNPGPIQYPGVPIYLAGVNPGLARLAGECADGFHAHPFHTPRYLKEVVVPAIEQGVAKASRKRSAINISTTVFVVTRPEEASFVRAQIAFYASTPSYRGVMALHGWQDVAENLSALAGRGAWGEMPALISDEMVNTFALVTSAGELSSALAERYQSLVDRLTLYIPFQPGERDAFWQGLLRGRW
jgi:probable F420-dependent oxidoreductase